MNKVPFKMFWKFTLKEFQKKRISQWAIKKLGEWKFQCCTTQTSERYKQRRVLEESEVLFCAWISSEPVTDVKVMIPPRFHRVAGHFPVLSVVKLPLEGMQAVFLAQFLAQHAHLQLYQHIIENFLGIPIFYGSHFCGCWTSVEVGVSVKINNAVAKCS